MRLLGPVRQKLQLIKAAEIPLALRPRDILRLRSTSAAPPTSSAFQRSLWGSAIQTVVVHQACIHLRWVALIRGLKVQMNVNKKDKEQQRFTGISKQQQLRQQASVTH